MAEDHEEQTTEQKKGTGAEQAAALDKVTDVVGPLAGWSYNLELRAIR